MATSRPTLIFLLLLTAVALYLCYLVTKPFLGPAAFAVVLVIVFQPLHQRVRKRLRNPNAAALVSTLAVLFLTMIPAFFLARAGTREVAGLYRALSEKSVEGGGWLAYADRAVDRAAAWMGGSTALAHLDVRAELGRRLEGASASLVALAASAITNATRFVFNGAIAFFTLFFLFRGGRATLEKGIELLPLERERAQRLLRYVEDAVVANVYGVLAVATVQAVLVGVAFALVGLPSPVFWGLMTGVCSLIPVVGTALVWGPATIYLLAGRHWWKASFLLGWSAGFVGLADNIVRPWVVGHRVRLNQLLVLFALLGGVEAFGPIGLFVGPIVLSVTAALIEMVREEARAQRATGGQG
jgi:predicted PurR-regulated permease PerM